MGGQEGNALHRRRFSFLADIRATETVDTAWSFFFGITALADSKTLTGGQSNPYVVCMYQLFKKKKKKRKVAVAEPSVTFDVIEFCLTFCHFCHSQPIYALIFWTESASYEHL